MNSRSPLVSIVIPVYNRSHLIRRTLNSLLNQSLKDFEVIIIDDCSDDSEQLVNELEVFKNSIAIRYYRHETNQHGAAARNTGISMAAGKFIALLDSDDLWHPHKLSACCNYALENPEATVIYSQIQVDEGGGTMIKPESPKPENMPVSDYLLYAYGTIQTSSLFLKSEVAKQVLFDPELKRFQDYDFCLRLEEYGYQFYFIAKPLVIMTDDDVGNRISNSIDLAPIRAWLNKIQHRVSKRAKATFIINRLVRCLLLSNQKSIALKHLFKPENIFYSRKRVWFTMLGAALTPSFLYATLRKIKRSL